MLNCQNCNKECKNKAGLTLHLQKCQSMKVICDFCNKGFCNPQYLKKHLEDKKCTEHKLYIKETFANTEKDLQEKINEKDLEIDRLNKKLEENKQLILNLNSNIDELNKTLKGKNEKIKELEKNITVKKEEYDNIVNITSNLTHKVGIVNNNNNNYHNHSTNNTINLPMLTDDIIGKSIESVQVDKLNNMSEYAKQLFNMLEQFAILTDPARRTLQFNYNDKEIKDPKGELLCDKITSHPKTENKKEELNKYISDKKANTTIYDGNEIIQNLHKMQKVADNISDKKSIQRELPKLFKTKICLEQQQNNLTNFLNDMVHKIKKEPEHILIHSPVEMMVTNKYFKDINNLIIIDDNEKEHKLNEKDLCYMLQYIYENVISFKSQMTDNEIKMLITYLNINTDENINNNKYNLDTIQSNIKWLSSITDSDERIKQILEDLELY